MNVGILNIQKDVRVITSTSDIVVQLQIHASCSYPAIMLGNQ